MKPAGLLALIGRGTRAVMLKELLVFAGGRGWPVFFPKRVVVFADGWVRSAFLPTELHVFTDERGLGRIMPRAWLACEGGRDVLPDLLICESGRDMVTGVLISEDGLVTGLGRRTLFPTPAKGPGTEVS